MNMKQKLEELSNSIMNSNPNEMEESNREYHKSKDKNHRFICEHCKREVKDNEEYAMIKLNECYDFMYLCKSPCHEDLLNGKWKIKR